MVANLNGITIVLYNNRTSEMFVGSSGNIELSLGGLIGRGEYTPFEDYQLILDLANLSNSTNSTIDYTIDRTASVSHFEGPKRFILSQAFKIPTINPLDFTNHIITFDVVRQTDSLGVPILFWPLIMPTIACYFVLAGTLLLSNRREDTGNKLTIFLAIFIFAPAFFLGIQNFLPLRAALALPEVLIENLIVSAVVFTIFSCFRTENRWVSVIKDGIMIFLSFVLNAAVFSVLLPAFPSSAQWVILVVVLFYSGFAVLLWSLRAGKELVNRHYSRINPVDKKFFNLRKKILLMLPFSLAYGFSLLIMNYGLLLMTLTLGTFNNIPSVVGLTLSIVGGLFIAYFLWITNKSSKGRLKKLNTEEANSKQDSDCI